MVRTDTAMAEIPNADVTRALLDAIHDFRNAIAGPIAPDEQIRKWPLWGNVYGIFCGDAECPLMAENSEILMLDDAAFDLDQLHAAIGEHIAHRADRQADEATP
jgi:hypothetical protein